MDILIKTTRISYRNNKYKRGYSFRIYGGKIKRAALEWDYFVLQEHMKSLIYVDCSLRGDSMKHKLIDELNLKISCMQG